MHPPRILVVAVKAFLKTTCTAADIDGRSIFETASNQCSTTSRFIVSIESCIEMSRNAIEGIFLIGSMLCSTHRFAMDIGKRRKVETSENSFNSLPQITMHSVTCCKILTNGISGVLLILAQVCGTLGSAIAIDYGSIFGTAKNQFGLSSYNSECTAICSKICLSLKYRLLFVNLGSNFKYFKRNSIIIVQSGTFLENLF